MASQQSGVKEISARTGEARAETRESSRLMTILEVFLEPVEQGILILDQDRSLVFANRSARDILPSGKDGVRDEPVLSEIPGSIFEKCRREKTAITYVDVKMKGCTGHRLIGLEACYIDSVPEGPVYLMLFHDFSKWKELDESRSKFATMMSHRMRTPLTSIRNVVKLMGGSEHLEYAEKEKLLDIGWRNVEKLIANLDELQKIFMIESEEESVCRTMVRVKHEMRSIFEQALQSEKIKGYKMSLPEIIAFTGQGRLRDFIGSAIESYDRWLSEKLFIECSTSVKEEYDYSGVPHRNLVLYLRPRTCSSLRRTRESLKDFLTMHEAHRGLVLGRLAKALDGEYRISPGNTISLSIPLDPVFDREKDLVNPLHMMIERADISRGEFSLVSISMKSSGEVESKFNDILEKILFQEMTGDSLVAKGEKRTCYSLFLDDMETDAIDILLGSIKKHFLSACRSIGEEVFPSLQWEVKYNRKPGIHESPMEILLSADMV